MLRSFKIRLYPTKEQEKMIWNHIGACRFIWNHMLYIQQQRYERNEKYLTGYGMINLLKPLKNDGEHGWLYEVSNRSLQIVCTDLDRTFCAFFNKAGGHTKYKSRKRAKPAYPVRSEIIYFVNDKYIQLQVLGRVKYKTDYHFEVGRKKYKFCDARIKYIDFKWILIVSMECESQALELTDKKMGIDLGVKDLAVVEYDGEKIVFGSINKSRKMKKLDQRIQYLKRKIKNKTKINKTGDEYKKSKNYLREEKKLIKLCRKQSNIRKNYIHHITRYLVNLRPMRIVMEDAHFSHLIDRSYLGKLIKDQSFCTFTNQMRYKSEWAGIDFVLADRFYPSSKTCSNCGNIKSDLKLSDRVYHCEACGFTIDRDYNAAINLSRYEA